MILPPSLSPDFAPFTIKRVARGATRKSESNLQPLTGEALAYATSNPSDGARLDIAVNGFWGGRYESLSWT